MHELKQIKGIEDIKVKDSFKVHFSTLTDYDEFMRYNFSYLKRGIRVNTLKISVEDLKKRIPKEWILKQVPWCPEGFWIEHTEGRRDVGNLLEHQLGYIYIQEPASMLPPVVLDPKPGDTVLDMCAAPGSKTSQIAQYMKNEGLLVANDYKGIRLKPLGLNVQRMGIYNTILTLMSGNRFKRASIEFDKILVDAPCSGTGTIRKSLKTLQIWNENMTRKLASDQKQLLETAFHKLKPGGTIVYSTCSVEPEEDEGVVSWILDKFEDAYTEKIELNIKRSPTIDEYKGERYHEGVKNTLRIWPQDNDTEGFFVAKIKKKLTNEE